MARSRGFTLIELMIVVAIVAILAAIAYPSYVGHITHSRQAAAEACLSNFTTYMERYYATNLRYDQDGSGNAITLPSLNCSSAQNTGQYYSYGFKTGSLTQSTYTLQAVPKAGTSQADRATQCATLSIDQTGKRDQSGTGSTADCWGH